MLQELIPLPVSDMTPNWALSLVCVCVCVCACDLLLAGALKRSLFFCPESASWLSRVETRPTMGMAVVSVFFACKMLSFIAWKLCDGARKEALSFFPGFSPRVLYYFPLVNIHTHTCLSCFVLPGSGKLVHFGGRKLVKNWKFKKMS